MSKTPWLSWSQARDLCLDHGLTERAWIRLSKQEKPGGKSHEVRRELYRGKTQYLYWRADIIRLLQVKES
jgi:hypothetical protein